MYRAGWAEKRNKAFLQVRACKTETSRSLRQVNGKRLHCVGVIATRIRPNLQSTKKCFSRSISSLICHGATKVRDRRFLAFPEPSFWKGRVSKAANSVLNCWGVFTRKDRKIDIRSFLNGLLSASIRTGSRQYPRLQARLRQERNLSHRSG